MRILLLFITLFLSVSPTRAQLPQHTTAPPTPSPTPSPEAWTVGTIFSISTHQPIQRILREDPHFIDGQFIAQSYITAIESRVIRTLRATQLATAGDALSNASDPLPPLPAVAHDTVEPIKPCDLDSGRFRSSVGFMLELRGLPEADLTCLSEYIGGLTTYSSRELYYGLQRRSDALFRQRYAIANATVGNWSAATDFPHNFPYESSTMSCNVNIAGGVRVGSKWYMMTLVTNDRWNRNLQSFQRQFVSEFLHVASNGSGIEGEEGEGQARRLWLDDALLTPTNERPPDGDDRPHTKNPLTTTLLTSGQGAAQPSYFGRMYMEDVPALQEALDMMQLSIQQASDALTPSSIAILTLPLTLNVIPSYLITSYSSSWFLLAYALLTDVLTTVPLAIKGVELLQIGRLRAYAASGRVTTPINGTRGAAAGAHMWAARCAASQDLVSVGAVFVVLALGMMVLGMVLEFGFRAYLSKRIHVYRSAGLGPSVADAGPTTSQSYDDDTMSISGGWTGLRRKRKRGSDEGEGEDVGHDEERVAEQSEGESVEV